MIKNFKAQLQEWMLERDFGLPRYETKSNGSGPDHLPVWDSRVFGDDSALLGEALLIPGKKKDAEQMAARNALERLEKVGLDPMLSSTAQTSGSIRNIRETNRTTCSATVFVDADHVAFVTRDVVQRFPIVRFRVYQAHGAMIPHVKNVELEPNVRIIQPPSPVPSLVDVMIIMDVARDPRPDEKLIVVSCDKLLHSMELLEKGRIRVVKNLDDLISSLLVRDDTLTI